MDVVAGDLPAKKAYTLGRGRIVSPWGAKKWPVNIRTVEAVEYMHAQGQDKGFGHTAYRFGEWLGNATVPGAALGGTARPNTMFRVLFRDGRQAICHGSTKEYQTLLKWSLKK